MTEAESEQPSIQYGLSSLVEFEENPQSSMSGQHQGEMTTIKDTKVSSDKPEDKLSNEDTSKNRKDEQKK